MRWSTIAIAVLGLAFLGAGCGGGDDESAADTDTVTVTETTSADETTTEETTTGTTDLGALAAGDCRELVDASAALGRAFSAPGSNLSQSDAFQELADRVPEEIRDDYEVLADAFSTYSDALKDVDVTAGQAPSAETLQAIQQAIASIDQQEVTEASNNISAWVTANCSTG